jgi:hypothetical protein
MNRRSSDVGTESRNKKVVSESSGAIVFTLIGETSGSQTRDLRFKATAWSNTPRRVLGRSVAVMRLRLKEKKCRCKSVVRVEEGTWMECLVGIRT